MTVSKTLTIKEQIDYLLKLQEINQENHVLQEDINLLDKELTVDIKKLGIKQNQYDKHYPYLKKIEEEKNSLEEEVRIINEKIEKDENKKKKIKTIKEFKAINKEIEFLIRDSAVKENNLLNKINSLEFKKSKVLEIKEKIESIKESIEFKKKDIDSLKNERQETINKKIKEKDNLEKKLPINLIKIFNRIYHNREQKAVVPIIQQVCHGCYIKIPLQQEFDIKKNLKLSYCPYCSRILYIEE